MKEVLLKRQKVFAWGYEDMPGIDREIAEHRIPTHSHVTPVKTKTRLGSADQRKNRETAEGKICGGGRRHSVAR